MYEKNASHDKAIHVEVCICIKSYQYEDYCSPQTQQNENNNNNDNISAAKSSIMISCSEWVYSPLDTRRQLNIF